MIDDLNDYIGAYGHPNAYTPNIDRLAGEGAIFLNAHAQAPLCGPSRASIMTGLRPSTTGIYGQIEDESIASASEATWRIKFLPAYLGEQGYHTMGVGKLFHRHVPEGVLDESGGRSKGFGPKPPNREFFHWNGEGTSTDWGAFPEDDSLMPDVASADWAIERLAREYQQPFFLGVGFLRPHVPFYVPQKWFDLYDRAAIVTPPYRPDDMEDMPKIVSRIDDLPMMPTTEWAIEHDQWRSIIEAYLACVSFVDHQVGRILEALEESGHRDNTFIILLSDHGYRLGEKGTFAKHALWQEATRVPLIIAGPGIDPGTRVEEVVELLDLYPTILDLADLPAYSRNEGRSLVPLIHGEHPQGARFAITTYGRNNHAVVANGYRYIQYEDGSEELYDHWKDPYEFTNVATDPVYENVRRMLRNKLPKRNRLWAPASEYPFNAYFENQREEQAAAFDFSVEEAIQYCVLKAGLTAEKLKDRSGMPVSIEHGENFWSLRPSDRWAWTNGFWAGILWYAYEASGDAALKAEAMAFTEALKATVHRKIKSHDIGFIANCGFGNGYRLTGIDAYRDALLSAADRLAGLFNAKAGTLLSWPSRVHDGTYAPHNTIIDSMMNLELLFKAADLSGKARYREIAIAHADTVMRHHIRPDGSTSHLVVFDRAGNAVRQVTHQGYADDSTWARGQAWGIYGFTVCYRETGARRYLETARTLARTYLKRLPADGIPYWDFDDPAIPDAPRDASAAAIAASALLELSGLIEDAALAENYRDAAVEMLTTLSTGAYRTFDRNSAFLDHSTGNKPRNREVDVPIIYADYYYLEALLRLRAIDSERATDSTDQ